jgi:stress response protein YsnF
LNKLELRTKSIEAFRAVETGKNDESIPVKEAEIRIPSAG